MDEQRWPVIERFLLKEGLLKDWQVVWAKHEQAKTGEPIGQILIKAGHLDAVSFALAIAQQFDPPPPPKGRVFAFLAAKGGAGATFLAVNAAVGLAGGGRRALLVDLNLLLPNAVLYLNLNPARSISTACAKGGISSMDVVKPGLAAWGDGLDVLGGPRSAAELDVVKPGHVAAILDLAREEYDYIVVDLPAQLHLDECAVAALDRADRVCPVFPATVTGIANAMKITQILRDLKTPDGKVLPVANAHRPTDPPVDSLARYLAYPVGAVIPSDPAAVEASLTKAEPVAKRPADTPLYLALAALVNGLAERNVMPTPHSSGFWDRLMRLGAPVAGKGR